MTPWPVALFVGTFVLIFAIPVLAFAICIEVMILWRLVMTLTRPAKLAGGLFTAAILGPFAYMFGYGAYQLSSAVINGFISRFL